MSLAPAGFYYQAGATAYLIDPAGAYSPAGASAPTTDPAGTDGGAGASAPTLAAAGVYIPIAGATSAAAEIVDPAGAYSPAGASAPTTDPAGTDGGAGASAPTLAAAGAYIPVTGATSAAAEIVDPAGAYSLAGASAPTTDPAGRRSAAGASAPTLAAAGRVHSSDRGDLRGGGDCRPCRRLQSGGRERADDRSGRQAQRRRRGAPTLAAPGASIPVTEATSAAAKIVSPPGTYLPPGATAPIADPGGTYSAAGATAPTTDPAGTYSSPYALNRLFLEWQNTTPANAVLSFHSATAVANYYGATSPEASLAKEFFAANYARHFRDNAVHANWPWAEAAFARGQHQQPHSRSVAKYKWLSRDYFRWIHILWARQSLGRHEFFGRRGQDKGSPQSQFASRGRDGRKFDRAGNGFVHGIRRSSTSLRHVGLVRQH